jgi:hypothetical protein
MTRPARLDQPPHGAGAVRLVALHARARCALGVAVALIAVGAACRALAPSAEGLLVAILGPLAAVSLAAFTLAGADPALERTTPRPWPRWRAAELAAGALAAVLVLLPALLFPGEQPGEALRNGGGFGGLAALGAVTAGARLAWVLPSACAFAGAAIGARTEDWLLPLTWPAQPGGDRAALTIALLLALVGAAAHARRGARDEPLAVL